MLLFILPYFKGHGNEFIFVIIFQKCWTWGYWTFIYSWNSSTGEQRQTWGMLTLKCLDKKTNLCKCWWVSVGFSRFAQLFYVYSLMKPRKLLELISTFWRFKQWHFFGALQLLFRRKIYSIYYNLRKISLLTDFWVTDLLI